MSIGSKLVIGDPRPRLELTNPFVPAPMPPGAAVVPPAPEPTVPPEAAYAAARRILHDSGIRSQEVVGPGFRAQNICVGDVQVVARDSDIKIIFQRQRNRVINREHNLAVMQ